MKCEVVVIGAGPAGMAAATTAAQLGLETVLLDEQPRPGGQIWRNVEATSPSVARLLGPDYSAGTDWTARLRASGATLLHDTLVWDVNRELQVTASQAGAGVQLQPRELIAATGAMERASPVPGWTLPGVLNAGAAQIALKSGGSVPAGRVVLAGAGPLLLLVACQLLDAGATLAAVVETSPPSNLRVALPHLPRALRAPEYLLKGARLVARLRRSGVRWWRAATGLRVLGEDRVQGLSFTVDGSEHSVAADTVLLHHGVVPNHQLTRLLRAEHAWDEQQLAWRVVCDAHGQTSVPGLRAAGDAVAIFGAAAAVHRGTLAALGAAHKLGRLDAAQLRERSRPHLRALAHHAAVRPFLDALYRPAPEIVRPGDDVIVCRCEEVTAGRIREMARLGCAGPNQAKFFSRCGMGPCQGRVCAGVVTQLMAQALGRTAGDVGSYRVRPPLKPIPLGSLAQLAGEAETSHDRS